MTELEIDYAKEIIYLKSEITDLRHLLRIAICPYGNQFTCRTCNGGCYHYEKLPEKFKEE
jgi:hypothetical protein